MSFTLLSPLQDIQELFASFQSGSLAAALPAGGSFSLFSRDLSSSDHLLQPLSRLEEQRLRALDRKAKGDWLTVPEDREFEQLLAIRRYHQIRRVQPGWTHQQVLRALRGVA